MADRKWGLVAKREYVEHLRTKAFWIGILSFPVLFLLIIMISSWLAKKVDVRQYAVIDKSGWLLEEVEKRSQGLKYGDLLEHAMLHLDPKDIESVPDRYKSLIKTVGSLPKLIKKLDPGQRKRLCEVGDKLGSPDWIAAISWLPKDLQDQLLQGPDMLREYWSKLPTKDQPGFLADPDRQRYRLIKADGRNQEQLQKEVDAGKLFAFFVICKDPVTGKEPCQYISKNQTDMGLRTWFRRHANAIVRDRRIAKAKIDPKEAKWITASLVFQGLKVEEGGQVVGAKPEDKVLQWAPMVFVYLLWLTIVIIAQVLMTSTIEEKSNRVIEVLLSSVSPLQLMAGKIMGGVACGLTMVFSWAVFFVVILKLMPGSMMGGLDLSIVITNPTLGISFLVYFLLGYLFFAAILVGIGSVCTSLKEAQNLLQPVIMLLIVPLLAMVPIAKDPNGTLAQLLSFIPPYTPFVMMNRAAGPPAMWEYAATTAIMLVTLVLAFWAAAKVFRIGILMTGKAPNLREIIRWLRAPVGGPKTRP